MSETEVPQAEAEVIDSRTPPGTKSVEAGFMHAAADRFLGEGSQGVGELKDVRETYAREIAKIITWTFAVSAVLILFGLYRILLYHPEQAETLMVKAGMPALKEAGTYLSSVFGPLLAFVLGYYFGEHKTRD